MGSVTLVQSDAGDNEMIPGQRGTRKALVVKIHFLFLFIIGKLHLTKDFRFRSLYCSKKKKIQNPNHVLVTIARHITQKNNLIPILG